MINIMVLNELKNKIGIINEIMKNDEEIYFTNSENDGIYVLVDYKRYRKITEDEFTYNNYVEKCINDSRYKNEQNIKNKRKNKKIYRRNSKTKNVIRKF